MCALMQAGRNSESFSTTTSTDQLTKTLTIQGRAQVSGEYLCQACNAFGCSPVEKDATTTEIFVTGKSCSSTTCFLIFSSPKQEFMELGIAHDASDSQLCR